MTVEEVIELVKDNILTEKEARFKEVVWHKKEPTNAMVEKGKGEVLLKRNIDSGASREEHAKKYVNNMEKGKVNYAGKQHEYTGGKIRMGLDRSHLDLPEQTKKREIFAKKMELRKRGDFTDKQVLKAFRSGTLTEPEYKKLMAIKPREK